MVIEDLIAIIGKDTGLAYFYCDYADEEIQAADKIIASLLKQLCLLKPSVPIHIAELYEQCQRSRNGLDLARLSSALATLISAFNQTFVIIDALDEFHEKQRKSLLSVLKTLRRCQAKWFITSRSHPTDIKNSFETDLQLTITAQDSDIRTYLRTTINEDADLKELTADTSLRGLVIDTVAQGAQGM